MKKIARVSMIGLSLAAASFPALAHASRATVASSVGLSRSEVIAARNTARDYIVSNHLNALRANKIDLSTCRFPVSLTPTGEILVGIDGVGIYGHVLLTTEEYDVIDANVVIDVESK